MVGFIESFKLHCPNTEHWNMVGFIGLFEPHCPNKNLNMVGFIELFEPKCPNKHLNMVGFIELFELLLGLLGGQMEDFDSLRMQFLNYV